MKELSFEQAKYIARLEKKSCMSVAIEQLESYGFDCTYYWETMSQYYNVDNSFDDDTLFNVNTRNTLFDKLGIRAIMDKAYEEVRRETN